MPTEQQPETLTVGLVTLGIGGKSDGSSRYASLLADSLRSVGVGIREVGDARIGGRSRRRACIATWSLVGRPTLPFDGDDEQVIHAVESVSVPETRGVPIVVTVHDLCAVMRPELVSRKIAYLNQLSWRRRNSWHAVIVPSRATMDDAVECGLDPALVSVIRHPVAPGIVDTPGVPMGGYEVPDAPFVLCIGPPSLKKGTDILLRAFNGAPAASGNLVWITSDRRSLLRYEGARDLERRGALRVFEALSDPALVDLCKRASALVVPSRWEGFSFPIAESLAVGTGVIASDIPAHREHGNSGGMVTLVRAEDDRELTEAILAALESPTRGSPVFETTQITFAEAHAGVYRSVMA